MVFAGGTKESAETIEECLVREIKEEIGTDVTDIEYFNKYERKSKDKRVIASYFRGRIADNILLNREELSEYKWFALNNIPQNLAFQQNFIIADLLRLIPQ